MKLIDEYTDGRRGVRVYRSVEWEEFVVRFYVDGELQDEADYHTDDLGDARDTADLWIFWLNRAEHLELTHE